MNISPKINHTVNSYTKQTIRAVRATLNNKCAQDKNFAQKFCAEYNVNGPISKDVITKYLNDGNVAGMGSIKREGGKLERVFENGNKAVMLEDGTLEIFDKNGNKIKERESEFKRELWDNGHVYKHYSKFNREFIKRQLDDGRTVELEIREGFGPHKERFSKATNFTLKDKDGNVQGRNYTHNWYGYMRGGDYDYDRRLAKDFTPDGQPKYFRYVEAQGKRMSNSEYRYNEKGMAKGKCIGDCENLVSATHSTKYANRPNEGYFSVTEPLSDGFVEYSKAVRKGDNEYIVCSPNYDATVKYRDRNGKLLDGSRYAFTVTENETGLQPTKATYCNTNPIHVNIKKADAEKLLNSIDQNITPENSNLRDLKDYISKMNELYYKFYNM